MKEIGKLEVWLNEKKVGTLAQTKNRLIAFEYDDSWILEGFSISPLSLPLEKKVFIPKPEPFEGLFGVFSDSLPDGWGRLLVDRILLINHENPHKITPLQRLAIVGSSGMGALTYRPQQSMAKEQVEENLDKLAQECSKILKQEMSDELDKLFTLGGSSGGARPKILTSYKDEEWLIKFASTYDSKDIGYQEYCYAQCAKQCGITVEETNLFESKICKGYFGTKRFDRRYGSDNKRVHMVTVSGLLETSHRIPNLDYHTLMKLVWIMTKEATQIEEMFRRMCFNVFSHNRDDHSKNFSFLYCEEEECWKLTPAYDMTYSNSIGGEHATCVDGNGKNPGMKEILVVGVEAGIAEKKAKMMAEEIYEKVNEKLCEFF